MFWIGAASGAFFCLLLIVGGFGVMFWQVSRDRERDSISKNKVEERLFCYWEECNRAKQEENEILSRIAYILAERDRK